MNCINSKYKSISFSISKMLRTPVLRKGRKVKHHYKAFRTVLSMMVEFNLARQVLGVKHNNNNNYENNIAEFNEPEVEIISEYVVIPELD